MNLFNRIVVVSLLLVGIVLCPVVLIAPLQSIDAVQGFLRLLQVNLSLIHPLARFIGGATGALFLFLLFLFLLWMEFRRPRAERVRLLQISGGEAELSIESIAHRLEHNIGQLPEVVRVKPQVKPGRGGIQVHLDLETTPEINVPAKTEEVCQMARQVVEEKMGLRLEKVRVTIRHAPYPPRAS